MFGGALVVETVSEGEVLGVVGDGHVLVAALAGGVGHLLDGATAVGFDGVHVDVAKYIVLRYKFGKSVVGGGLDLSLIFA